MFRKPDDLCSVGAAALRQGASEPRREVSFEGSLPADRQRPPLLPDEDPIYRSKIPYMGLTLWSQPQLSSWCVGQMPRLKRGGRHEYVVNGADQECLREGQPPSQMRVEPSLSGKHLHALHPV